MDLEKLIGQKVNLNGTAKDAKGGAVLITSEGYVIYIKGLESWSSEFLDKHTLVSELLKKDKLIPDPKINENGTISTWATGNHFIFENSEYSIKK